MSSIWHLVVTVYDALFANPLYGLPHVSLVLALTMSVLGLSALCINAWRNLVYLSKHDEESYYARQDTGMNMLIYGIVFFLYLLTTTFLYYHVNGPFPAILGVVLILFAWGVTSDSVEFRAIPFGDAVLLWFAGINLAMRLWALGATHEWRLLLPLFDGMQSFTLWCIEAVLAVALIRGFVKAIRQSVPEIRRMIADGRESLRGGR